MHDDLVINGQSQEEKMDIASIYRGIFSTSGIASGAF